MSNIKEFQVNNQFYDIKDAFGRAIIANEFNSDQSYEVGDLVQYGDFLYKCLNSCSGSWNWNNWSQTRLLDLYNGGDIEIVYNQSVVDRFQNFLVNRSTIETISGQASQIRYYAFYKCASLTTASFPQCSYIGSSAFGSCPLLQSVYLLSSSVCVLQDSNAFISTPIQDSSYLGYFGSVYVPLSLVDAYKVATNWIEYADRITAFEG